ncbi:deleted in malignant brain tumors 1 protein-like [Astyanax mexicanus]|uniref:deleted in malignant brain tumors 1 protein-like n=1 Tax=Astyanax mexicanus TaxID=7994 RepID=UPI0020CA9F9E|nr:deleted in malignant brain tumors 1 protein-like [Astyanax mexicanus]
MWVWLYPQENFLSSFFFGSVRLVDGGSRCAGRVEVLHRGQWGTVCGDDWDMSDAAVVCRELGCGEAVDALGKSHFGSGSGPIWMDDVDCSGSESRLKNCRSPVWGKHGCNETHNSGVICSGARLVLGSRCSERVEVLHGESWVTVCDADFDQQGAEVVCRELGCGSPVKVLGAAAFGRGEGQVWSEVLQCRGNKSQTHFCPKSSSLKHNCSHDNDVGLVCADSVRLADGGSRCAGRAEVFHRGQWGTICGAGANFIAGFVMCKELGCGEPFRTDTAVPGCAPIWMSHVKCTGSESTLKHCGSLGWGEHSCNHNMDIELTCSDHRTSRLADGPHVCSGRVEVFHGASWFTVCDADFDQQDAEVVCRELGCGSPVEVLGAAAFGKGKGQVWSEELQCRGDESEITLCPITSSHKYNCSHGNDVGLVCSGHTQARLMNGSDSCSGRVELQYLSEWGTVCDVSWDMSASSVLCAQLKCGSAVAVLWSDWFGEGSGRIWADVFDFQGNETHLLKCPISSWSRTACSHKQDVGLICSGSSLASHEGGVRLSGGMECEGEVEVFFRQDWRRVLLDSWSESEASVVCRQLGCGSVLNTSSSSSSSPEHSYMCVTGFNCSGSEAHLRNCSSSQAVNCSSTEQLYITCSGYSFIRLVGSGGDCAGRLEVFHSGSWGTVSDELWDIEDAQVVCRQLQCGVALSAPVPVPARFGSGTGPIWLNEVECEGNEASLWNCRYQLCGEDECGHKDDVGVVCSGEKKQLAFENLQKFFLFPNQDYMPIRLRGGEEICSGRLEVYHNAEWGSICADLWDIRDAQVVCRQLGCGPALSANRRAVDGSGGGTIWMNRVKCRGNEIHLWDCPHSLKIHTGCSHSAGVTCADIFVTLPFSSETTTTYTTVPAQLTEKKTVPPSKNPSSNFPYIYPVSLLVLGSVLFLALVLLVVLFYQNRVLRRVISKARRKTLLEAVYEEINHKCVTNRYTKRGSFISEDQHSGYEDVDEELLSENYGEVYDDIIPAEESPHITTDSVRLVDGGSRCAGRVEVLHRGHWGTVCDDYWDMRDAAVVCRELGCGEAIDAPRRARFGSGSGPIWVEYANCAGSESSLKNCRSYDWGRQRCNHDEDAGAVCAEVRLVGRSRCSGRVEVLHGESWVTVCDADFDQQDAEVVCRELGCGSPVEVLGAAAFGRGEGQVCLEELQCRGSESQIHFCPKSSSLKHNCSHDNDVGLVCADSVRLVDGGHRCAGRVEVFYNRTWRSVCGKNWDIRDAAVVCSELGCAEAVFKNVQFGPRSAWMDDANCSGSESSVKHCRSAGWVEQICNRLAGVICSGVRLVGRSRCSGRVEVLHGESWVTVCDADFDQQDAEVVCRELGCGSLVEVLGAAAFGRGEGQVWSEELQCRGNESQIHFCPKSSSLKHNCSHDNDVGLACCGHTQARLMNGSDSCSGRVELQYLSEWGTVCDVSWDMRAASVLCAQLKCGSSVAVLGSDWFGEGSGRIWAGVFDCQGNETHLLSK